MANDKVLIEVLRNAMGCCVTVNDTRVAGPKLLGGASVMLTFSSDKKRIIDALAGENDPDPWELLRELTWRIDDCHQHKLDLFIFATAEQALAKEALKQHDEEKKG